jgi:hypothetical protein
VSYNAIFSIFVEVRFTSVIIPTNPIIYNISVVLGSLVVIVLAIGPKVRGLKPGCGRWIFNGDKSSAGLPSDGK